MKLPALGNPGGLAGAWVAPIRSVLARKDSAAWNHAHKGAQIGHGQQAVDATTFTQEGLSNSNLCQLCVGCEDGDQVGTHLHRFFCPTTKQQVRSLAPSWIRDRLDTINGSLSPVEHCALIRGMVAPTHCAHEARQRLWDDSVACVAGHTRWLLSVH